MHRDLDCLFTFSGSRLAIKADFVCREQGIPLQVVTVPTSISSECGMALRVDITNKERVSMLLGDNGIEFKLHNI